MSSDKSSFGRIVEALALDRKIAHLVLVVTDADHSALDKKVVTSYIAPTIYKAHKDLVQDENAPADRFKVAIVLASGDTVDIAAQYAGGAVSDAKTVVVSPNAPEWEKTRLELNALTHRPEGYNAGAVDSFLVYCLAHSNCPCEQWGAPAKAPAPATEPLAK
jgi:hypothetical protein